MIAYIVPLTPDIPITNVLGRHLKEGQRISFTKCSIVAVHIYI
ncbi:hypothetical protein VIBNISOn1_1390033 [Vibrio nigripulchritudo SOn1]|uniref:Uncharacterized protein n=1 Tax=Vibrio nigripulchritudo SOn1 TaxID=1238450 RepID=A0AAV2VL28_9VIBR|nr:hypothetical protein [Vibrio nigripulchritudo]CCO45154.1 hypothetical protein VIBNISOn1_1390033 [Vibrio nigripulchritudo SOn1]